MADRKSKIRFTRADLKDKTAGQAENTATRRRPRPPSEAKGKSAGLRFDKAETASESANQERIMANQETDAVPEGFTRCEAPAGVSGSVNPVSGKTGTEEMTGGFTRTKAGQKKAGDAAKAQTQKKFGAKLRTEQSASKAQSAKLRFESSDVDPVDLEKPVRQVRPVKAAQTAVSGAAHAKTAEYENDNVGVEALNETEGMAETGVRKISSGHYSRKLRYSDKAEKLDGKSGLRMDPETAAESSVETGTKTGVGLKGSPAGRAYSGEAAGSASASGTAKTAGDAAKAGEITSTNPISRWRQKQAIKNEYAAARAGKTTGAAGGSAAAGSQSAGGSKAVEGARKAARKTKDVGEKAVAVLKEHPMAFIMGGMLAIAILVIASSISSCSAMLSGSGNAVLATSFTATDEDIRGAEADYCAMEEELRERIRQIEEDNPDYDEYEINTAEINHNPYELAAFLTVLYEDYTREEVQRTLREIFEAQYEFSTSHRTETVTETREVRVGESLGQVVTSGYCNCPICCGRWSGGPTASGVYPTAEHTIAVDANNPFVPMGTKVVMNGVEYTVEDTGNFDRYGVQFDVYYDSHWAATLHGHQTWEAYIADDNGDNVVEVTRTETKRILTVEVTNHSLNSVVEAWGLTDDQLERYRILVAQRGNRDYLFADNIYANPSEVLHYDIPGEALSDVRFARMINEAEKYLGYPYVWGGASPSTSFDCSGFVSWVINHCGNGWNYGRLTAEGLRNVCAIIPRSEAKPGDLIFFQGTYDTSGASHVGIYVGNGMMIHCGNPIQYASIDTSYWQQHFYCFGRLP